MRSAKFWRTNNSFPVCLQNYHASILSQIVSHSHAWCGVFSCLIPILNNTSWLLCIRLTPQVLLHASCNIDQQICMPILMSINVSLLHLPLYLFISRSNLLQLQNYNDCEQYHHFLLLKQVQLWKMRPYFWTAFFSLNSSYRNSKI